MSKSIGEKVHYFRKRANMSQTDLEIAIDTSSGTISRIEQGTVNPTKETLLKIAHNLKLLPIETIYLTGELLESPNLIEAQNAKASVSTLLGRADVFGYLLDHFSRVQAWSQGFIDLSHMLHIDLDRLIGRNIVEIIFDPELGVQKALNMEKFEEIAIPALAVMNQEREFLLSEEWFQNLIQRLEKLPRFKELWEKSKSKETNFYDVENRKVHFNLGGQEREAIFHLTVLFQDPRFSFIEYVFIN